MLHKYDLITYKQRQIIAAFLRTIVMMQIFRSVISVCTRSKLAVVCTAWVMCDGDRIVGHTGSEEEGFFMLRSKQSSLDEAAS